MHDHCNLAAASPAICAGAFLTLHYRLTGPMGDIINTFGGKPSTLSLGTGELSPGLERRLIGLREGAHETFHLPAGEAFGPHNPAMRQWVSRERFCNAASGAVEDAPCNVGDVMQFASDDGAPARAATVVAVAGDAVQFDFNHPLAGQPVTFEVHIIGVL